MNNPVYQALLREHEIDCIYDEQSIPRRDLGIVFSEVAKALSVRDSLFGACRRQVISMLALIYVQNPGRPLRDFAQASLAKRSKGFGAGK